MMGKRSPQAWVFAADHMYLDYVGRETIYGYLAQHREDLFRDEDFAALFARITDGSRLPPVWRRAWCSCAPIRG